MYRAVLYVFVIVMFVLLGRTAWVRFFDPDEFQHLEMAWLIATGEIPYKDFFEHHVPIYHFLISPLLSNTRQITNGDVAVRIVMGLRFMGVTLCAFILILTYFITSKLAGRLEALFASALLVSSIVFIQIGVQIRPDQLASLLLLIATLALMLAKESDRWRWYVALCGVTTALAILSTQKILLAVPGLAGTFFIAFVQKRMSARRIVEGCGVFAGAAAMITIPLLFYFWSHDALDYFIEDNFLLVGKWKHSETLPWWLLFTILREDGLFVFFIGIGLIECLKKERELTIWWLAILAPFFSLLFFIPIFPVIQRQYVFLMLPYAAILGGVGAALVIRMLAVPKHRILQSTLMVVPGLAIALHGVSLVKDQWKSNNHTLEALRYVVEQTAPNATVMPSWTPGIAFRRPAFFYFSLHSEIRFIIPQKSYTKLLDDLRSGDVAPAVIQMDDDMKHMPSEIVDVLKKGWEPTGLGDLWRRKQDADKS